MEQQQWEMAIRPVGQAILAAENFTLADPHTHLHSEQESIVSHGKKRSSFRMIAIVTALFVASPLPRARPLLPPMC